MNYIEYLLGKQFPQSKLNLPKAQTGGCLPKYQTAGKTNKKDKVNQDDKKPIYSWNSPTAPITNIVMPKETGTSITTDSKAAIKYNENRKIREAQERKDRIAAANAMQKSGNQYNSTENYAIANSAIGDKLRISESPNIVDDYLNPFAMIGDMASGLATVPNNIEDEKYGQAALAVASPLVVGAVAGLGTGTTGEFVNNVVNPFAGLGEHLVTNTPLKNTYKYNPWAWKPNPNASYRQVFGEAASKDFLQTPFTKDKTFFEGVMKPKMNAPKNTITFPGSEDVIETLQMPNTYFAPFFQRGAPYYDELSKKIYSQNMGKETLFETKLNVDHTPISKDFYPDKDKPSLDEWFDPAQERHVLADKRDQFSADKIKKVFKNLEVIDQFKGNPWMNPENYNKYHPNWLTGYKKINQSGGLQTLGDISFDSKSTKEFAAELPKNNNLTKEREVIGTDLKLKKIGKVKNDLNGFDWIVKPKMSKGGILNKKSDWEIIE